MSLYDPLTSRKGIHGRRVVGRGAFGQHMGGDAMTGQESAGMEGPISQQLPDPRKMQEAVEYLASPELAGRAPGSHGGHLARDFVQGLMEEAGLRPAGVESFSSQSPRLGVRT